MRHGARAPGERAGHRVPEHAGGPAHQSAASAVRAGRPGQPGQLRGGETRGAAKGFDPSP